MLRAGTHKLLQKVSSSLFGADAANYSFKGAAGNITITPRLITGSIQTGTSTYGQRLAPGAVVFDGLFEGDVVKNAAVKIDNTGNTSAGGYLNTGYYTGIASVAGGLTGTDGRNYSFAGATGDYAVTKADLNILYTARYARRTYGTANPEFIGFTTVTGLARGESLEMVTTGSASYASDATASSNVGKAGIFGSGVAGNSSNYNFNFGQAANNSKALTINQATLSITATPLSRRYGSENPLLTYNQTGLVNGDTLFGELATSALQTSNVGKYAITLGTLSAGDNYRIRFSGASLTVTPATLTYLANPVSREFGTANPALTGSVSGFVLEDNQSTATTGTLRFTTRANGTTLTGSYAIDGAGLTATNKNYIFVQDPANASALTVTKP